MYRVKYKHNAKIMNLIISNIFHLLHICQILLASSWETTKKKLKQNRKFSHQIMLYLHSLSVLHLQMHNGCPFLILVSFSYFSCSRVHTGLQCTHRLASNWNHLHLLQTNHHHHHHHHHGNESYPVVPKLCALNPLFKIHPSTITFQQEFLPYITISLFWDNSLLNHCMESHNLFPFWKKRKLLLSSKTMSLAV